MNYNSLMNKPTINYRELIGDNSVTEVGGITEEQFNALLNTDLSSYYTKAQIDDLFSRSYMYREKSGNIVTFDCPASVNGIDKVVSEIVAVQSGSGDPSPHNIRPFTGWSAVNRYRTGNNLFDYNAISNISVGTINRNGMVFTKQAKYTVSAQHIGSYLYVRVFNADGTIKTTYNIVSSTTITNATFTLSNGEYFALYDALEGTVGTSKTRFETWQAQVEIGDTPTTYEAFSGTTYTTALKDGQGNPMTCYGGELSNENGVQILTVTHGYIASYNGETLPSTWISDRDVYAEGTTPTTGAEVVYELATPQTIPQDNLPIVSTGGLNNIWCDSGDITVKALDKIIQG